MSQKIEEKDAKTYSGAWAITAAAPKATTAKAMVERTMMTIKK